MSISIDDIRSSFPFSARRELNDKRLRRAAVLILFFHEAGELSVLLTRRTEDVEHHKGQISFPGGSQDDGDASLIATALRETEEEIGLQPDAVKIFGMLDDFETPSGFAITPVVGTAAFLPALKPNPDEVAEILHVPVGVFTESSNERVEHRIVHGVSREVYFYRFGSHEIWGATAAIMRAFLRSLGGNGKNPL
jgi:8-oxo-dGTP pyrophosphatase MutT (NUDIX family)